MIRETGSNDRTNPCCSVEALVTVDERGQMVLPKELRKRAGIEGGEKVALSTVERDGRVCCIVLTKTAALSSAVQAALGTLAAPAPPDAAGCEEKETK